VLDVACVAKFLVSAFVRHMWWSVWLQGSEIPLLLRMENFRYLFADRDNIRTVAMVSLCKYSGFVQNTRVKDPFVFLCTESCAIFYLLPHYIGSARSKKVVLPDERIWGLRFVNTDLWRISYLSDSTTFFRLRIHFSVSFVALVLFFFVRRL